MLGGGMHMKLAQLEAFYSVIRAGSISKAARQMHLTQPALSMQIRDLEEFFNTQLLERTNKGVRPTAAGELVYYYGQKLMGIKDTLCSEIAKLQTNTNRPILVGAGTVVGGYSLPCSIYAFRERHPQADIQLTIGNTKRILEMLTEGSLDMAFVEGPMDLSLGQVADELIAKTIGCDQLMLVAHPDMVPEDKETYTMEELRHLPLLIREHGSGIRASLVKAIEEHGFSLTDFNIVMELNSLDAIKASLGARRGFSILSYVSVKQELYYGTLKGLKIESLSEDHPYVMLHPKRVFLAPLEKAFIDFMKSKDRSFC